jgi:hypothetical protein
MIRCPRCNAELEHHEPDKKWRRFFRCASCLLDWHYSAGVLLEGKAPHKEG